MDELDVRAAAVAGKCDFKSGPLPECAPLASTNVPRQQENSPKYDNNEALTRGTLFPGLDLPFMNKANSSNPYAGTPLGDLMALSFVIKELNLYLDTHKTDQEAFRMMKKVIALYREGVEKYTKMYGPISLTGLEFSDRYDWLESPWPWEFSERSGDK